jgi:4-hydroxy-3-methylbut-2-enyl diphosphate reductase
MRKEGREIVMIGHKGHPEVEGTMGQSPTACISSRPSPTPPVAGQRPARLAYVTQTTLSVDDAAQVVAALKERFPEIIGPKKDDICYATQNRQDSVKQLARTTKSYSSSAAGRVPTRTACAKSPN